MRDDELDALLRQALHDDPWRPDVAAAELRFAQRIRGGDMPAGIHLLWVRWTEWTRAARPPLVLVATAVAVVAVALLVAGPLLLVRGMPGDGPDTLASGGEAPAPQGGQTPNVVTPTPSERSDGTVSGGGPLEALEPQKPAPPASPAARAPNSRDSAPNDRGSVPEAKPAAPPAPARRADPPAAPVPAPKGKDPSSQPPPSPLAPPTPTPTPTTAVQPYTPTQVCGAGFRIINRQRLSGSVVYLLWNGASQENCVVTLKTANIGEPTRTTAHLTPEGAGTTRDAGDYEFYANVTARAPGCIQWGGSDSTGEFTSPTGVHCSSGR